MQRRTLPALFAGLLAAPPLHAAPFLSPERATEVAGVRVVTVIEGLERPWAIAFLPDGSALITERPGRLRLVQGGRLLPEPIAGLPPVLALSQGGLLDVAAHPDFTRNRLVFLTHATGEAQANRTRLVRARLEGTRLSEVTTLFETNRSKAGGAHFGSRIVFLPDGTLLVSIGDGGNPPNSLDGRPIREQAQDPASHIGKVIRLDTQGRAPADNPFRATPGYAPEIFSVGHRNIQGMAFDPTRNLVWASEHGSSGGDELNILRGGQNHGWPAVSWSVEYRGGAQIGQGRGAPGLVDPALVWERTFAPSGLAIVTGDRYPGWRGDVLAGGLRGQAVHRIRADAAGRVTAEEVIKVGRRVRDVRQGPDGYLYLLTDEAQGALLRIEPTR